MLEQLTLSSVSARLLSFPLCHVRMPDTRASFGGQWVKRKKIWSVRFSSRLKREGKNGRCAVRESALTVHPPSLTDVLLASSRYPSTYLREVWGLCWDFKAQTAGPRIWRLAVYWGSCKVGKLYSALQDFSARANASLEPCSKINLPERESRPLSVGPSADETTTAKSVIENL